jgi:hypothetical protein
MIYQTRNVKSENGIEPLGIWTVKARGLWREEGSKSGSFPIWFQDF